MATTPSKTAIILIDPYNDFLHSEGKLHPWVAESLSETNTIKHINDLLVAARSHKIPVFYGLHHQYTPTSFDGWQHLQPVHNDQQRNKAFEEGSWGAKIFEGMEPKAENGDVVFSKHWSSSSFQNTDLDFLLRQRGISNVILAGLTANACVEATARYAYDLGYPVTMLSDATAAFTIEQKQAATDVIWPLFAKVLTVDEYVATLGSN